MKLYIAEKREVAEALAQALGNATRTGPAYSVGADRITWLRGHLLQLAGPEEHNDRYRKWRLEDLPLQWPIDYRPVADKQGRGQLDAVIAFIRQADELVNAGDPDPEGQRLVDEVIEYAGAQGKPTQRLLINDNNPAAIRKALAAMDDNANYRGLSLSALARSVCDQRYGYNLTRAYTLLARKKGYDDVLSVGRVQTPILGLIVRRDRAHEAHTKQAFYTLSAEIEIESREEPVTARYLPSEDAPTDDQGRVIDKPFIEGVAAAIAGQRAEVRSAETREQESPPPLPHNLLSLQAEAAGKFGYKPGQVLEITQRLRDQHRAITYNRSDCRYLNDERYTEAPAVLQALASLYPEATPDAQRKSKAFDSEKVGAHHAIIPTENVPTDELDAAARRIYDLIAKAYLAQFYLPERSRNTRVLFQAAAHRLQATGRVVVDPGWRRLYAAETQADPAETAGLEAVQAGDRGTVRSQDVKQEFTRPPPRYTMQALLKDLARVAKYVEDPEIRTLLLDKDRDKEDEAGGIGTPATRDAHIETLFKRGYVEERGTGKQKQLVSSQLGREFHDALPPFAVRPDMTALWHAEQQHIEAGDLDYESFIGSVDASIQEEIQRVQQEGLALAIDAVQCPRCQEGALRKRKGSKGVFWGCGRYPDCRATYPDGKDGKPDLSGGVTVSTEHACPKCQQGLIRREARKGTGKGTKGGKEAKGKGAKGATYWWGCSGFPACDYRAFDDAGKPKPQ